MGTVQRICENCGEGGPIEARYCPHCGHDSQATLPSSVNNLPMIIGKAALPILAGAASLALRIGWKLLQERLESTSLSQSTSGRSSTPTVPSQPSAPSRPRRTVHIRSTWAVGDANGIWRRGSSEHTIEFDD